jgi:hypothetical protein
VVPNQYGSQEPWNFVCLGCTRRCRRRNNKVDEVHAGAMEPEEEGDHIQPVGRELRSKKAISLRGLRKEYPGDTGTHVAVHGLNLDM